MAHAGCMTSGLRKPKSVFVSPPGIVAFEFSAGITVVLLAPGASGCEGVDVMGLISVDSENASVIVKNTRRAAELQHCGRKMGAGQRPCLAGLRSGDCFGSVAMAVTTGARFSGSGLLRRASPGEAMTFALRWRLSPRIEFTKKIGESLESSCIRGLNVLYYIPGGGHHFWGKG